jgi:L-ascorbate 6-phosphate lactonase
VSRSPLHSPSDSLSTSEPYNFTRNDPFDRSRPVELVVPQLMSSRDYMSSIRDYRVPEGSLAIWFMGQNGFILKDSASPLIGIDLYLTNSCAVTYSSLPFRVDRQLPIFIEPEDLDIDVFITTHSHQDHADPETIRRTPKPEGMLFIGPYDSCKLYEQYGVRESARRLIHPGEALEIGGTTMCATFALPTDNTDLNHTGMLLTFPSGITFFNSGDTAWAELLPSLLPSGVDICAICINGGYHNLPPEQAAMVVKAVNARVAIPCHYDLMINNVGSPEMFRMALERSGAPAKFQMLRYYQPWLYKRDATETQI